MILATVCARSLSVIRLYLRLVGRDDGHRCILAQVWVPEVHSCKDNGLSSHCRGEKPVQFSHAAQKSGLLCNSVERERPHAPVHHFPVDAQDHIGLCFILYEGVLTPAMTQ
jgi:hypothetical protein